MTYDQAQSARIGQKVGLENPGIRLVESTDDVIAPYQGQLVYVVGDGELFIYKLHVWETVGGGTGTSHGIILPFPSPLATWTGVHNFAQMPVDVTLTLTTGEVIMGNVSFPDGNTAQADFGIPVAGYMLVQK